VPSSIEDSGWNGTVPAESQSDAVFAENPTELRKAHSMKDLLPSTVLEPLCEAAEFVASTNAAGFQSESCYEWPVKGESEDSDGVVDLGLSPMARTTFEDHAVA
jgi:hypothetical protein